MLRSGRFLVAVLIGVTLVSVCFGQQPFTTGRSDNQRTSANTSETILTPSNVNKAQFGRLFRYSLDYQALAQPLYVPNVAIPSQGTHNVVYVATMADSVYAFDADSNQGANAAPLWSVNFTDPANGITTASVSTNTLPCASTETAGPGFTQEGIVSTPVIDNSTGTLYVVAKTLDNGTVHHRLHALDITNGQEKFGGPVVISATSTSNKGHVWTFNSLHQKNRPGLLLLNGNVYIGFGSNYCNDVSAGWVLSYNAATLAPGPVFNASPDKGLASIWQSGEALPADENGLIYVETSESGGAGGFDVNTGGQSYGDSVIELNPSLLDPNYPNQFQVADYFTPSNFSYINSHDLDLSSTGALVLPPNSDGTWTYPRELVAAGKQGIAYVLNRDSLGGWTDPATSLLQAITLVPGSTNDVLFSSAAYWNNTVYFAPNGSPLLAFPLSGGLLQGAPPCSVGPNGNGTCFQTSAKYPGAHSPSISANGNSSGILWAITGTALSAFDATTLKTLYTTNQNPTRDSLPQVSHFATQTVANGKVYVATRTTLETYGLFPYLSLTSGGGQSATVFTTLPTPLQVQLVDPYSGGNVSGVTVTFSDGGKGGVFTPSATATTDANGFASASYQLPKKSGTYTITISATGYGNVTTTEAAQAGPAVKIISWSGGGQTGSAGTVLPKPLVAQVRDVYGNGVPGVTVNWSAAQGSVSPPQVTTDANGKASTTYTLPSTTGTFTVVAGSTGLHNMNFYETSQ